MTGITHDHAAPSVAVTEKDAETIVLPPPSSLNPIPTLPIALQLDNREQLLTLLQSDPATDSIAIGGQNRRQLLVFGNDNLRTLILRQVLTDPKSRTYKGKKNWDTCNVFPIPPQHQRTLGIAGTRLLLKASKDSSLGSASSSSSPISPRGVVRTATETSDDGAEVSLLSPSRAGGGTTTANGDLMEDEPLIGDDIDVVTYFIHSSSMQQTQQVAKKVRSWLSSQRRTGSRSRHIYHRIVFLPHTTAMCSKILLNSLNVGGLYKQNKNCISIHKLQLDIYPLESDVLSLEYDDVVKDVDVEGMPSNVILSCARSLLKIQDVTGGQIKHIQSIGPLGVEIIRKMMNLSIDEYMDSQEGQENPATATTTIDDNAGNYSSITALLVIDRKVDMVTPMVTPLTYEGLVDDIIGIDCGYMNIDVDIINPEDEDNDGDGHNDDGFGSGSSRQMKKKKSKSSNNNNNKEIVSLAVHGSDTLYTEVRDMHVEKFGSFLQEQAKTLQESHAKFTNKQEKKNLNEIHQFVKQIPIFTQNLRTLANHIHIAELIKTETESIEFRDKWQTERSIIEGELSYDIIEELIAQQYMPYKLLRLLCLQSICTGGIKSSKFDSLRKDIVQTYGYEFLFVLTNLEKVGLLRRREGIWDSERQFNTLRKNLALINAEVNTVNPDDISYVSSGYAPMSIRLIQASMKGWHTQEEALQQLPGRLINIIQRYPPETLNASLDRTTKQGGSSTTSLGALVNNNNSNNSSSGSNKPTLLVFFVGGVTYMEIAAMRFLSKRTSFPYNIICCTTKVINGSTLIHSLG